MTRVFEMVNLVRSQEFSTGEPAIRPRSSAMSRLLVIEDQKKLLQSLERGLSEEGYEVIPALTGEEGYLHAKSRPVDAIVLDLMLPERDGLDVLRSLRSDGFTKPILILTARDGTEDLEMNLVTRSVTRGGVEIELTRREFELLEFLLRNKNTAVTRDMIARDVWKEGTGTLTNTIDVYITLLRKKIERPEKKTLIHTVRGVGYALRDGA